MNYQRYDHSNPPYIDHTQPSQGFPPSAFELQRPAPVVTGTASPYQTHVALPTQYYTAPSVVPPQSSQPLDSYPPSAYHLQPPPLQHVSPAQTYTPLPEPVAISHTEPTRPPEAKPSPKPTPVTESVSVPKASVDTTPAPDPPDYLLLLLALAEEYFTTAHARGSQVACARASSDHDKYYKLIATGLGCLESLLKNWRLQPRTEALIRLRYASVLNEETENITEAETALDKGIALCERNRLSDLKYSMLHLQARVMYRKNPKAAIKWLDGVIRDVEAYQLAPWIYAFRFLSTSLLLQTQSANDTSSALQQLRMVSALASERGDHDVSGVAAIVEAQIHLRSGRDEAIEHAQKALCSARSSQLVSITGQQPHIVALVHILDLSCSLMEADPVKSVTKLKALQPLMDEVNKSSTWPVDGVFSVPIQSSGSSFKAPDHLGGVIGCDETGRELLKFSWMPARDVYCLSFLLSGATMSHRNSQNGHKAESYISEGLKLVGEMDRQSDQIPQSLSVAAGRLTWRRTLQCYLKLHWIFSHCARTDWKTAQQSLKAVRDDVKQFELKSAEPLNTLIHYVTGLIYQGTGNLTEALSIFQSPELSLSAAKDGKSNSSQMIRRDVSILASLNSIFILQHPSHPKHNHVMGLIAQLEPLCVSHQNQNIQSALQLIKATSHPTDPMIKKKLYLQKALAAAQAALNTQLICITLTFMSWTFFRGVVGSQAEKSARASWAMAMRGEDELWIGVTTAMMADTLEVQGQMQEAKKLKAEAYQMAEKVVAALQAGAHRSTDSVT